LLGLSEKNQNENGRNSMRVPAIISCWLYFYWQPVNCRFGVTATVVNGPEPVKAIGGFEFTSVAMHALVVMPSIA
jgi:hypothetical protein